MPNQQTHTSKIKILRKTIVALFLFFTAISLLIAVDALHFLARTFNDPTIPLAIIILLLSLATVASITYNKQAKFTENAMLTIGLSILLTYIGLMITVQLTIAVHGLFQ